MNCDIEVRHEQMKIGPVNGDSSGERQQLGSSRMVPLKGRVDDRPTGLVVLWRQYTVRCQYSAC